MTNVVEQEFSFSHSKTEQLVAQMLAEGMAGLGIFDDWDEYIGYLAQEEGWDFAITKASEVAASIDWMNERLPEQERTLPGSRYLEEALAWRKYNEENRK